MTTVTINLNGRYAPGDKDWHRGTMTNRNDHGVTLKDSHGTYLYPWCKIDRIDYHGN